MSCLNHFLLFELAQGEGKQINELPSGMFAAIDLFFASGVVRPFFPPHLPSFCRAFFDVFPGDWQHVGH